MKLRQKSTSCTIFFIQDMDQYCLQGNCLAILIKSQIFFAQDSQNKSSKKTQNLKLLYFLHLKNSKTFNTKAQKEKKKKYCYKKDCKNSKSILATSFNMTKAIGKNCKDISKISYYNCTKKNIIWGIIPNPGKIRQKIGNGLGNLYVNN